jgi:ribosomal protein L40E
MPDPVFCPECRAEYLWTATVCAECDVALVPAPAIPEQAGGLPPVSELVCIRASAIGWARGLSERLAEAGISHRIEAAQDDAEDGSVRRPGANLPFGVYVRAEDLDAAVEVDAAFMQSQIPDLEGDPAAEADASAEGCPACGADVPADASECPDCGLALL